MDGHSPDIMLAFITSRAGPSSAGCIALITASLMSEPPRCFSLQKLETGPSDTSHSVRSSCQEWIEGDDFVIALDC